MSSMTHVEASFPTDRGNFEENVADVNVKRYILETGPCKPSGPFLVTAVAFPIIITRQLLKLALNFRGVGCAIHPS